MIVDSFNDGKTTTFGHLGKRRGFRFNFSDQHVLPNTLSVPTVSTRLCFDSKMITEFIAILKKLQFFKLLKYLIIQNGIVSLLSKIKWGKEICTVKVDVWGEANGKQVLAECFFHSKHESTITAQIAAKVAEEIYHSTYSKGVYHVEQLFPIDLFQEEISIPEVKMRVIENPF
ncbi:hypothetical protein KDN24_12585 [Bacillus sp. Bva_UNVM-123]|uniref:hypothetical protein n=1 Tax=Bacillus sp. Bva_UNVM-123 TaxID=2829798 RepID=UPI00391FA538